MVFARALLFSVLGCAALAGAPACAADADDSTTSDDDEIVASRCESNYVTKLRAKIATARERLVELDTPYARTVRDELDAHRVEPLPFCKVTKGDFEHIRKDVDLSVLGATPEAQYAALRRGDASGMKSIHTQVYGYQWENRIYLATDMSDARVLATLAHETQHVLRQAHLRNFKDQRVTCVEELEAYKAEVLVKKPVISDEELAKMRVDLNELYELDHIRNDTCTYK
jgi:hypothetical protein